jgi:hypothetical protein
VGRAAAWAARELALAAAAPVTNRVADAADVALGAYSAHASTRDGARGLHGASMRRGRSGPSRRGDELEPGSSVMIVGGQFWHGGDDRANALAQLGIDFAAFEADLAHGDRERDAVWIVADVAPALAAWKNFVARIAASRVAAYVTEWSVFESWWQRLVRLREAARARGIPLESMEPIMLPKTVWERGAGGVGSQLDTWMTLGKTAIFGAMAITGVVGFYSIAKELHGHVKRKLGEG